MLVWPFPQRRCSATAVQVQHLSCSIAVQVQCQLQCWCSEFSTTAAPVQYQAPISVWHQCTTIIAPVQHRYNAKIRPNLILGRPYNNPCDPDFAPLLVDLPVDLLQVPQRLDPRIAAKAYHLFVQVHRAEHLGGGREKYNPYITCEFAGHTLSLPAANKTHSITCDECFKIPVVMPLFADSVVVRVWNKAKWGSDGIIVQGRLLRKLARDHIMLLGKF